MVNSEFEIKRSVLVGDTTDVYLQRTLTILRNENINPVVTIEFSSGAEGIICGLNEVKALLGRVLPETGSEVWALEEGESVDVNEVALRVKTPYSSIGLYETVICGILASSSGWASSAKDCVVAAGGTPVVALGAHNAHPNIAAEMDYASIVGGCVSCSTIQGARLASVTPSGNMPHSLNLIIGETVQSIEAFDRHMPQEVPRISLVDTFRDESEDAINAARSLRDRLRGIRLGTPDKSSKVSSALVSEIRARLDLAGFRHVEIMVSGGFTPEKIRQMVSENTPVDSFGVGYYISSAEPNPFTANIQEIDGRPIARKGRIPGVTPNPRLDRVI